MRNERQQEGGVRGREARAVDEQVGAVTDGSDDPRNITAIHGGEHRACSGEVGAACGPGPDP